MITGVALCLLSAIEWKAADYFPLSPGTKWHYVSQVGVMTANQIDEAKEPIDIAGELATPIETRIEGRLMGTSFYRCDGDTLYLVAEDAKKPLKVPQPILKVGDGKQKWAFSGETMFLGAPAFLESSSEANLKSARAVLDTKTDTFEVRTTAKVGNGSLAAVAGKQTMYYAKGIGLVEMISEQVVAKNKTKATLKLIRFEQP